jgi:hypothetical protein
MSTATEPKAPPKRRESEHAHLPLSVSLAPAPCRMIAIEVYDDDGAHHVHWEPVIGLLCMVEAAYSAWVNPAEDRKRGVTHQEMIENGWRSNWDVIFPEVFPVVASRWPSDLGEIRVLHQRDDASNLTYRAIVPCTWSPDQDQENAVRIGRELVKRKGIIGDWIEIPEDEATP